MTLLESIPQGLRLDKEVTPFITRSIELENANPVVSYHCKFYVLDHILTQKLHVDNPEVEAFTLLLLDETEALKLSDSDETLKEVLNNRQLSLNAVFLFAFKIFNSCLEDLNNYDGVSKAKVGSKLKAAINFWSLLLLFYDDKDGVLDYGNITGGQCPTVEEFKTFCKEKQKSLKFNLSRLIKNEIPVKNIDEELERELEFLSYQEKQNQGIDEQPSFPPEDFLYGEIDKTELPEDTDIEENDNGKAHLGTHANAEVSLPGAPSFDPSTEPQDREDDLQLPGAPKFLPDDDLSHINKKSSIVVFSPDAPESKHSSNPQEQIEITPKKHIPRLNTAHVTKENLNSILDFGEQISKVQKHAKFAISALNYEDLATAEKELLESLELLKLAKLKQST